MNTKPTPRLVHSKVASSTKRSSATTAGLHSSSVKSPRAGTKTAPKEGEKANQ